MSLMQAAQQELAKNGYHLFVTASTGKAEVCQALEVFAARRFAAGLIVPDVGMTEVSGKFIAGLSIISLLHDCAGENVRSVLADEVEVIERAVAYLNEKGHRRICSLVYPADT